MKSITPIVPVSNINKSTIFFEDTLGFQAKIKQDNYAYLTRDDIAIRLICAPPDVNMHDEERQISCYIDVEDVDGLYKELEPKLENLPEGRLRKPFNQSYGQREFHVIDEDALLIFFGEKI